VPHAPPPAYSADHTLAPASLFALNGLRSPGGRRGRRRVYTRQAAQSPLREKLFMHPSHISTFLLIVLALVFVGITVAFAVLSLNIPAAAPSNASPSSSSTMEISVILLEVLPFIAAGLLLLIIGIIWRRGVHRRSEHARVFAWRAQVAREVSEEAAQASHAPRMRMTAVAPWESQDRPITIHVQAYPRNEAPTMAANGIAPSVSMLDAAVTHVKQEKRTDCHDNNCTPFTHGRHVDVVVAAQQQQQATRMEMSQRACTRPGAVNVSDASVTSGHYMTTNSAIIVSTSA